MKPTFNISYEKTHVKVTYLGDVTPEFPLLLWSNIVKVCEKHNCFKILGIATSTKPPTTIEAFDHAKLFRELNIDYRYRIAWVEEHADSVETIKFIETVLNNRGLPGKLFSDVAEAKEWLLDD